MKKDLLQNLKEKSKDDLLKDLLANKEQLWQLQLDLQSGKVKNIREIRKVKKTIATINTIIKVK